MLRKDYFKYKNYQSMFRSRKETSERPKGSDCQPGLLGRQVKAGQHRGEKEKQEKQCPAAASPELVSLASLPSLGPAARPLEAVFPSTPPSVVLLTLASPDSVNCASLRPLTFFHLHIHFSKH